MTTNIEFIGRYLRDTVIIANKISSIDISKAIDILNETRLNGNSVFIAGNGGSASSASHFASDLNKYVDNGFRAFALVDNIPLNSALTNDLGWSEVYAYQLENFMKEGDVFVAISVHGGAVGQSENLMKAVNRAKKKGCVISLTGHDGGLLKEVSDVSIVVPSSSTPQIEGFHLVLTHLMVERLRELVGKP